MRFHARAHPAQHACLIQWEEPTTTFRAPRLEELETRLLCAPRAFFSPPDQEKERQSKRFLCCAALCRIPASCPPEVTGRRSTNGRPHGLGAFYTYICWIETRPHVRRLTETTASAYQQLVLCPVSILYWKNLVFIHVRVLSTCLYVHSKYHFFPFISHSRLL